MVMPDAPPSAVERQHAQQLQHAISKVMVGGRPDSAINKDRVARTSAASEKQPRPPQYHPGNVAAVGYFTKEHTGFRKSSDASGSSAAQRLGDSGDYVDIDESQQPEIVEGGSRKAIATFDGDDDHTREAAAPEENWLRRVASDGRSHVAQVSKEQQSETAFPAPPPEQLPARSAFPYRPPLYLRQIFRLRVGSIPALSRRKQEVQAPVHWLFRYCLPACIDYTYGCATLQFFHAKKVEPQAETDYQRAAV